MGAVGAMGHISRRSVEPPTQPAAGPNYPKYCAPLAAEHIYRVRSDPPHGFTGSADRASSFCPTPLSLLTSRYFLPDHEDEAIPAKAILPETTHRRVASKPATLGRICMVKKIK